MPVSATTSENLVSFLWIGSFPRDEMLPRGAEKEL